MVRESTWKRAKTYLHRMQVNKVGRWMVLLLLLLVQKSSATQDVSQTVEYLPKNVVPTSYDVKLILHIAEGNFTFTGESTVVISVLNTTSNITLHAFNDLQLHETSTKLTNINAKTFKPKFHQRNNTTDFLTLTFPKPIDPGNYQLSLKFAGNISEDYEGIHRTSFVSTEKEKVWLVASGYSVIKARRIFPCWDEPALKATFNMSIQHLSKYTAVSNMPVKNRVDREDGQRLTVFEKTPIMSTYIVGFVVSDGFQCISNVEKSINVCARKELLPSMKMALEMAGRGVSLIKSYTGITYPLPKLDIYAMPDEGYTGVEDWGLITQPESSLIITEENTTRAVQKVAERFLHQLSHQWFGNLVSPASWKDVWIKEGLCFYFQYYFLNQMYPQWKMMDQFAMEILQDSGYFLDYNDGNVLHVEPKNPADITPHMHIFRYSKPASVFYMLTHITGKPVFQNGIRIFLKNHEYKSATGVDFWNSMQAAYKSDKPNDNLNFTNIMMPWIEASSYPIVKITRNYETETAILSQSVPRPHMEEGRIFRWMIPINYVIKSKPKLNCTSPSAWLGPSEANLTIKNLDKDDWLLVNLNQSGYYRVDYDDKNWKKLSEFLDNDAYQMIPVLNRVQMIKDLFYLSCYDQQNFTTLLKHIKYLSHEDDPAVWATAADVISTLRRRITMEISDVSIKRYILPLMTKILGKIGFDEDPQNDCYMVKTKRSAILELACDLGHRECLAAATKKLLAHLENPEENPLCPNLKKWIFTSGAITKEGQSALMLKINEGKFEYIKYLMKMPEKLMLKNFVIRGLKEKSIPKKYVTSALEMLAYGSSINWDEAMEYLNENFDSINEYINNTYQISIIVNTYIWETPTTAKMEIVNNFLAKHGDKLESWPKNVIPHRLRNLKKTEIIAPTLSNWLDQVENNPQEKPV